MIHSALALFLFTPALPQVPVDDLAPGPEAGSDPADLVRLGTRAYFVADDGVSGREPFITEGNPALGAELLADLAAGSSSSIFDFAGAGAAPVALGDVVLFQAFDSALGTELVVSGATPGTVQTLDLAPGLQGSNASSLTRAGDLVFLSAVGPDGFGGSAYGLWKSDGTAGGTEQVAQVLVAPDSGPTRIYDAEGVGGASVFFAGADAAGRELWRSDGTEAGTYRIADLLPGAFSSDPRLGVAVDGRFFFVAFSQEFGQEVWVTDGTAAGTRVAANLAPLGAGGASVRGAIEYDGAYVVSDQQGDKPSGPAAIDAATEAVTFLVDPSVSGADFELSGISTGGFAIAGEHLYFATYDPDDGTDAPARLWRTSGASQSGAYLGVDTSPKSDLRAAHVGDGVLIFSGHDGDGYEPWVARPDGTVEQLADLNPGAASSDPSEFLRIGSEVLFAAETPAVGRELFSTTVATLGANVAESLGGGCTAAGGAAPSLAPIGRPTLGAAFGLDLGGVAPQSLVLWTFDQTFEPNAVSGPCSLMLPAPTILQASLADGTGAIQLSLGIPADPLLLDAEVYFQAVTLELAGPSLGQVAFSDGLEVVVGP